MRDEKRKNRERDKERDKKKVPILSEVFALEQQLHAEKATVADLEARQREFDARERHLLERIAAAEAAAAAAASNEPAELVRAPVKVAGARQRVCSRGGR